jgi:hypothetical protein
MRIRIREPAHGGAHPSAVILGRCQNLTLVQYAIWLYDPAPDGVWAVEFHHAPHNTLPSHFPT